MKERSRCELKVKFYSEDGSEHDAEYCFPCAKDCLYWISHEIVMLVKGEKKPLIGSDLLQEIQMYERLLISVAERFKDRRWLNPPK